MQFLELKKLSKKINLLLLAFFLASGIAHAQKPATIHGSVNSGKSGENLIAVTIYDTINKVGAISNEYGFYSITVPNYPTVLRYTYYGHVTQFITITKPFEEQNIKLQEDVLLDEVVINANGVNSSIDNTSIGTIELSINKVNTVPTLLGEKDVLKTLQMMPGIKSGGEGSSGMYVRGGGPDQNLILLDGVPIYNASHLFGFFSVFNSDAISQIKMYKGGFPSRYGGRSSSVLDMRMKEGNNQHYNVEGSVGIIASRLLVEGPIIKDKLAFIVSARRTYADLLIRPFLPKEEQGGYYFYDLNAKLNYKINNKHHLYLSGYFGKDKADFGAENMYEEYQYRKITKNSSGLLWGNAIGALRWNYRINSKLFLNTTATYSSYKFNIFQNSSTEIFDHGKTFYSSNAFDYISSISDWTGKTDLSYIPNPTHYIRAGLGNTYHTFKPGVNITQIESNGTKLESEEGPNPNYSHESYIYLEDDIKLSTRWKVNIGVHNSFFNTQDQTYIQLQPRFAANYRMTENSSLKLGYSRMAQYLHLLSNTGVGLPTDLWVPATKTIKPVLSNQYSLGYHQSIADKVLFSVEGYFKDVSNIIQYKEGVSFLSGNTDWQNKVEIGRGWMYGAEFLVEKKQGKLTGWVGYTLSWSERQFDNINNGVKFPYKYDRRHDINIVGNYKINDKWDVSISFLFATGNAVTLNTQTFVPYTLSGSSFETPYTPNINGYRMPNYHRMDIGANRTLHKKRGESILSLSIYNVYNRQNAYIIYPSFDIFNGKNVLEQLSLFPLIPSISWKFKIDCSIKNEKK